MEAYVVWLPSVYAMTTTQASDTSAGTWSVLWIGVAASILATLIVAAVICLSKRARRAYGELRPYLAMGMAEFYSASEFDRRHPFTDMIAKCDATSEILMVGRTLRQSIEPHEHAILDALKRGAHLRCLIFDPEARGSSAALEHLQLKDVQSIKDDLHGIQRALHDICKDAKNAGAAGTVEVRTSSFLVVNSLLSIKMGRQLHAVLDFSFGSNQEDKYRMFFMDNGEDPSSFPCKLHRFYEGWFSRGADYISYSAGTIRYSESLARRLIREDLGILLDTYAEHEGLRQNSSQQLLRHTPPLLLHKCVGDPCPSPVSVQMEITNACNGHCKHCSRHKWASSTQLHMDLSIAKSIIDDLAGMRVASLTFSGGEPTLHPDFVSILEHAKKNRLAVGVLTNGNSISPDLAEHLVRNAAWVRVSVDGSNNDVNTAVRGLPVDPVLKSVRLLLSKSKHRSANCRLGIGYTIQRGNIEDVDAMIGLVEELRRGGNQLSLAFKFAHGHNGYLCLEPQLESLAERIAAKITSGNGGGANLEYIRNFIVRNSPESISQGSPVANLYRSKPTQCYAASIFSLIDAEARVYPCCHLFHDNDDYDQTNNNRRKCFHIDTVTPQNPFRNIWLSPAYAAKRKELASIDLEQNPECGQCTRHYLQNCFLTELGERYANYLADMGGGAHDWFCTEAKAAKAETVWL